MNAPQPTHHAIDQIPTPDPATSRRLARFGWMILAVVVGWFVFKDAGSIGAPTLLGLGILILSSLPVLRWAARGRSWFPAFEISMLTGVAFYALPLLVGHEDLNAYPPSVIAEAAFLVLLYTGAANLGFTIVRLPARAPKWAAESLLPASAHRYVPLGMTLNTLYLFFVTFTTLIPDPLVGPLRALFFGLGIISTFILARLWGQSAAKRSMIAIFLINLAAQCIILFTQLYLINAISLVALAVIAYSAARRRVPVILLSIFLPVVALLHLGKAEMRERYWEGEQSRPTPTELPAYFREWIGYSLQADDDGQHNSTILERASLIHILCLSVDRVPSLKPYLNGESYIDIPAQVVPRILWKDKPSSLLANVRLALYFNLVTIENADAVSIAFGVISEAYINFGYAGVGLLGLLYGAGMKRVVQLSQNAPQFSALGILMILLTAWSFQAELVLATWLASLFQAAILCIGLPLLYRRLTVV